MQNRLLPRRGWGCRAITWGCRAITWGCRAITWGCRAITWGCRAITWGCRAITWGCRAMTWGCRAITWRCRAITWRWRRRWHSLYASSPCHYPWNQVPIGIHALLIRHIVSPLRLPSINLTGIGACGRSNKKSAPSADSRTDTRTRTACRGADGGAKACSDERTTDGPCGGILIDRLLRAQPEMLVCPLPADGVLGLKFLKRLVGGW